MEELDGCVCMCVCVSVAIQTHAQINVPGLEELSKALCIMGGVSVRVCVCVCGCGHEEECLCEVCERMNGKGTGGESEANPRETTRTTNILVTSSSTPA